MVIDGACGIEEFHGPRTCTFGMGHAGPHSWEARPSGVRLFGGITADEVKERAAKGSVAAQAILAATEKP